MSVRPFEINHSLIECNLDSQRRTHILGIRKSYFTIILIVISFESALLYLYTQSIYQSKQDYLKDISNIFCLFIDDVMFPIVINNFCLIFVPILIIMGIYDHEPLCIISSLIVQLFIFYEFYNVLIKIQIKKEQNQKSGLAFELMSLTCIEPIMMDTIEIIANFQFIVCIVLFLLNGILIFNIKKLQKLS